MAADNYRSEVEQEFSTFGPWVYEINESYPLPRLFAPFFDKDDQAIMKIKIPRDIDRRNAKPGMNLYDYVIALYRDQLRILERSENDSVTDHLIDAADFMGIRIYKNMLRAACTLYTVNGSFSFSFNSASMDLIWKTANLILASMERNRPVDVSSLPVTEAQPKTMLLQNMLHDIRKEREDIAVGAVQEGMEVYPREDTAVKIERMLWKELNPEAIHLFTPKELIVLENGFFPNRAGMPDFGFTYTIMPLNKLTAVNLSHSKVYSLLMECTIYLGPNQLTYHYGVDNEEVGDFYTALKNL